MKKPLVVFVATGSNRNSIAALCGAIEKKRLNVRVRIVDEDRLLSKLRKFRKLGKTVVAFSFQTPDIFRLEKLIPQVKKVDSNFFLIAGGAHPSGAPEHTLKMGFDYVFVGEGEESLANFLNRGSKGNWGGKTIIKSRIVDIAHYPCISEKYRAFGPIEITRGCPFGCLYCQTTYLFGKIRHRTIKQIVVSVEILVANQRPEIRFVSPNLLSYGSTRGVKPNLNQLEEMLEVVRSVKGVEKVYAGSFPSEVRPEQLSKKALQIIKKYCDNDNLIIGAQSGSDSVLKKCHRGHSVDDIRRAIDLTLRANFKANIDFIFGMPGETKSEEEKTISFIEELVRIKGVRIHGHTFLPLPGTPWAKDKPGRISPGLRERLIGWRQAGKEYGDWQEQEKIGRRFFMIDAIGN